MALDKAASVIEAALLEFAQTEDELGDQIKAGYFSVDIARELRDLGVLHDVQPNRRQIGWLCSHGHFEFFADPEYDTHCGAHNAAQVYVEWDADVNLPNAIDEAEQKLGEQIDTWRKS